MCGGGGGWRGVSVECKAANGWAVGGAERERVVVAVAVGTSTVRTRHPTSYCYIPSIFLGGRGRGVGNEYFSAPLKTLTLTPLPPGSCDPGCCKFANHLTPAQPSTTVPVRSKNPSPFPVTPPGGPRLPRRRPPQRWHCHSRCHRRRRHHHHHYRPPQPVKHQGTPLAPPSPLAEAAEAAVVCGGEGRPRLARPRGRCEELRTAIRDNAGKAGARRKEKTWRDGGNIMWGCC